MFRARSLISLSLPLADVVEGNEAVLVGITWRLILRFHVVMAIYTVLSSRYNPEEDNGPIHQMLENVICNPKVPTSIRSRESEKVIFGWIKERIGPYEICKQYQIDLNGWDLSCPFSIHRYAT